MILNNPANMIRINIRFPRNNPDRFTFQSPFKNQKPVSLGPISAPPDLRPFPHIHFGFEKLLLAHYNPHL
jgi:hypothetical protein